MQLKVPTLYNPEVGSSGNWPSFWSYLGAHQESFININWKGLVMNNKRWSYHSGNLKGFRNKGQRSTYIVITPHSLFFSTFTFDSFSMLVALRWGGSQDTYGKTFPRALVDLPGESSGVISVVCLPFPLLLRGFEPQVSLRKCCGLPSASSQGTLCWSYLQWGMVGSWDCLAHYCLSSH